MVHALVTKQISQKAFNNLLVLIDSEINRVTYFGKYKIIFTVPEQYSEECIEQVIEKLIDLQYHAERKGHFPTMLYISWN